LNDGNFLVRFWRGDVSLALSFWVVAPIVIALAFALPEGVGWVVRRQEFNPFTILAAIVAIWTIVVLAQVFLTVGIWRAATNHRGQRLLKGRGSFWAPAAQVVLVVAGLNLARVFVQSALPELSEGAQMALFDDPALPPYSLRLMRDGSEAEIAGGLKFGVADEAVVLFASAPNLKVVHLNSPGGRLGEAIKLARLVRERGVDTYSATSCVSACTVVFAAGRERYLRTGGQLGFHRGIFAGNENAGEMRKLLLAAGIDPAFADRAVAQPAASIWYPTDAELVAGRVVTAIVDPYRFAASGFGASASLIVFERALREIPALAALGEAEPRLFEEMAEVYWQGYFAGWSVGQIEDELRKTKVTPFISRRLPQVEDAILVDYARLLADQYAALGTRDPAACYGFVTRGGDSRTVALMGAELQAREVALTERVLRSKNQRVPPTTSTMAATNTGIFKALSAQFGTDTASILAEPAKVEPAQYRQFCDVVTARFRAIAALPPRQAGELMSGLFATVARPAQP
jgi:hypothetical protein